MKPNELTVRELAARIARGEASCEALMRACLERIAEREAMVRAWVHCGPDARMT